MKDKILKYLLTIIVILLLAPVAHGSGEKRDSVVVSLITCWPGDEIYELCGHEALRVRGEIGGEPVDSIWNYGVFDFNQPNFVYRFVKGETDYMLAGYPFVWFLPEYVSSGRKVIEQDLNLNQDEAMRLVERLRKEGLPQNRTYRYNYVLDNCATRIVDRVNEAVGIKVIYPDTVKYGTFRNEMRAYHKGYPWYQFGIDLALGSGIDLPIKGEREMFVPVEMAEKAAGARMADGRPLVRETRILNEGVSDATLPPTPWYLSPLFICSVLFIIIAALCFTMIRSERIYRPVYSIWYGITGLAGCLIAFLVFFSEHEATSPNMLLFWLNPLQLIFAVSIWSRRMRVLSFIMAYYNIFITGLLLLVWQFQQQSANPAFFPLMGSTVLLGVCYALVAPKILKANKGVEATLYKKGKSDIPRRRVGEKSQSRRKTANK